MKTVDDFHMGDRVAKWIRTNQGDYDLAAGVVVGLLTTDVMLIYVEWDNLDGNRYRTWESPENLESRDWLTRDERRLHQDNYLTRLTIKHDANCVWVRFSRNNVGRIRKLTTQHQKDRLSEAINSLLRQHKLTLDATWIQTGTYVYLPVNIH